MIKSKLCIFCKKRFYYTDWLRTVANSKFRYCDNWIKSCWNIKIRCDECKHKRFHAHHRVLVPARYIKGNTKIIELRNLSKKQYQDMVSSVIERFNFQNNIKYGIEQIMHTVYPVYKKVTKK